jgi:hypothetical protein
MTELHLLATWGKIEVPQKGSWAKAGDLSVYFNLRFTNTPIFLNSYVKFTHIRCALSSALLLIVTTAQILDTPRCLSVVLRQLSSLVRISLIML